MNRKKTIGLRGRFGALGLLMVSFLLPTFACGQQEVKRDAVPMPLVHQDTLVKHVMELSSETYGGRLAGSTRYNLAVRYVEGVLRGYGVQKIEEQEFAVECNEVENCKFNVYVPGSKEKRVFTLGNEFCCAGMTGRGYVDAQLVFCGYGVDNALFNEYKGVDVKGKIAVVLTGLPAGHHLPQAVVDHGSSLRDKARTAERHGAIGMLAINVSRTCQPWEAQSKVYCGELPHLATFPVLQLTLDCGREIFRGEKMDLDAAIDAIGPCKKVHSFSLLKKGEVDVNAFYRPQAKTCNVVGILPGSDKQLAKEYIVVGASLDGGGMQGETCLFPSADINASGVAALLETARVLSSSEFRPKRSVLFVLFGAGEHQWMGSRRFLEMYPKLNRVEAFVGVQNIGYGDSLIVLGDARYPSLWNVARSCDTSARRYNMSFAEIKRLWPMAVMHGNQKGDSVVVLEDHRFQLLSKVGDDEFEALGRNNVIQTEEKMTPRGDARAFDVMGIPSIVVTTHDGMHRNHVTADIWENIDRRILTLGAQLVAETVAELGEGLYQGRSLGSKAGRF